MGEHKLNPIALAARNGMLSKRPNAPPPIVPVNVMIGHDGQQLVVKYSQQLEYISYTPEQAREHIKALQACLDSLEQRQAQEKLDTLTVEEEKQ